VRAGACAALRHDLVDLLIDTLIEPGLLRVGLIGGDLTGGNCLVDARMGCILQRCRDISRGLAVSLGHVGERLARKLGMQLLWGNANGGCRGVQAADAAAARATSTEATGEAFAAGWETSVGTRLANRRLQLGGGGA